MQGEHTVSSGENAAVFGRVLRWLHKLGVLGSALLLLFWVGGGGAQHAASQNVFDANPVGIFLNSPGMSAYWGSRASTQKLASKEWRFQRFYGDYVMGVLLLSLIPGIRADRGANDFSKAPSARRRQQTKTKRKQ